MSIIGLMYNSAATVYMTPTFFIDGIGMLPQTAQLQNGVAGAGSPVSGLACAPLTEAFHYLTPAGGVSSGTGTFLVNVTGMIRG